MVANKKEENFLSHEEIESLRDIIMFLKEKTIFKGVNFFRGTNIKRSDYDNFINIRSSGDKKTYRTQYPTNEFQKYALKAITNNRKIREIILNEAALAEIYKKIVDKKGMFADFIKEEPNIDELCQFSFYKQSGLLNSKEHCKAICNKLSGNYFFYRYSTEEKKIFRSFLAIAEYEDDYCVPRFVNKMRELRSQQIRTASGYIYEIGRKYVFDGFVLGSTGAIKDHCEGVYKLIIDNFGGTVDRLDEPLYGIFLNFDNSQSYDVGQVCLRRIQSSFNEEDLTNIDPLECPEIARTLKIRVPPYLKECGESVEAALSLRFHHR